MSSAVSSGVCPCVHIACLGKREWEFHSEKLSWHDAQEACKQSGGSLATVNTAEENEALAAYGAERHTGRNHFWSRQVWIGANDIALEVWLVLARKRGCPR